MARIIEASIDLSKIDKNKIRIKDCRKYYDITLIERIDDKYHNNWMIVEKQSKEEREAQKKGTILGNGKNYGWGDDKPKGNTHVSVDDLPI